MRLKWLGHSAVLLTGTKRVMIDPFLTGNPVVKVEPEEREGLDYIAVTHDHRDHLGDAEVLAKANTCPVVAVDDLAVSLQKRGVEVIGMNIGGRVGLNGVSFTMVQAVHPWESPPALSWRWTGSGSTTPETRPSSAKCP